MTYKAFSALNKSRCLRWHPLGLASWSMSDWACALGGEVGEVCEVALANYSTPTLFVEAMAEEIADVYSYADLFAQSQQIDFIAVTFMYQDHALLKRFLPRWTGHMQWALELAMVSGKLQDVVKKLNRERDGLGGNKKNSAELWVDLILFIGAVGHATRALATCCNIDLYEAVRKKFNAVSERMNFPERVP